MRKRRLGKLLDSVAFAIFGWQGDDRRNANFVPGNGGHGGEGGQVPPMVPYNPDWDPKNRIA